MKSLASSSITRRKFLRGASVAGAAVAAGVHSKSLWAAALPQATQRVQPPMVDKGFASVQKVGEGIYAVISDTSKGFDTLCNGGFVIGKDAVLLWEGFAKSTGAAFQIETMRSVSKLPIKCAIDSHYHFDHSFGNAQYAANGIPIWAHEKVVPTIMERYAAYQNKSKAAIFAPAENHLKDAVSERDKEHAEGDLNSLKVVFGLVDSTPITLPNVSLAVADLPMKVDLGGGMVVIIEAHPGHTSGDLILRIPSQDTVFSGDLLFNQSFPVTFDADMAAWLRALNLFGSYGPNTLFVPGHGPVCGVEAVQMMVDVFGDLAQHARQMVQLGVPLREAQARYDAPDRFKNLRMYAWGFCVDQAVAQFYKAASSGNV